MLNFFTSVLTSFDEKNSKIIQGKVKSIGEIEKELWKKLVA